MPEEEYSSNLIINLQRESAPGSGQYSNREMRMHFLPKKGTEVQHDTGYTQYFSKIGSTVAFVTKYDEGMIQQMGVDAIIETPDVVLDNPLIIRCGINHGYRMSFDDRNKSLEAVEIVKGGDFRGAIQAGFSPQDKAELTIGKTLDGKNVQLVFQDIRPMPAIDMPSSAMK